MHIVIVGGSSGIGRAVAAALLERNAEVTIAGRSAAKLGEAAAALGSPELLHTHQLDATDDAEVARLFASTGPIDHLVSTVADVTGAYQPITGFAKDAALRLLDSKVLSAVLLAKHGAPTVKPGGSITFTSGIAAYRPAAGGALVAAANGALGSLAAALAIELAPIRVNAVSPGWVDTPVWDVVAGAAKHDRLSTMAARLPAGRVGRPEDLARAFLAVLDNGFLTGTVLHVDGGQRLV